jgi:SAM-dependent methyltransferase
MSVPSDPVETAEGRARRRASLQLSPFGRVAAEYTRARPGYPPELIRWAVGTSPLTVADIAAGSGQMTRGLLAQGHRVLAVEPSPELMAELHVAQPDAAAVRAVAEALPVRSGSVDAVVVAQALHLLDVDRVLPEFARVLRPGGALVVAWNTVDTTVPWARRLFELIEVDAGYAEAPLEAVRNHDYFGPVAEHHVRHWHRLTRSGLRDLVSTFGQILRRPEEERIELLQHVDRFFDITTNGATLNLPLRAVALRAYAAALADYHRS